MLSELWQLILQSVEFLWPFGLVKPWEEALWLIGGFVLAKVGPGVYPKIPWLMELHDISVAYDPFSTGQCDITTKDQRTLTFEALIQARVIDTRAAIVDYHDYEHTAAETAKAVLSERLSDVDPGRFEPSSRNRLNTDLRKWVADELAEIGLEVKWVRFSTFVINPKMIRLLGSSGIASGSALFKGA